MMTMLKLKAEYIFYFRYAEQDIRIYQKADTEKAVEFRLFDAKNNDEFTKDTIWVPKASMRVTSKNEITGIDWIFNDYENKEKLRKAGYYLG